MVPGRVGNDIRGKDDSEADSRQIHSSIIHQSKTVTTDAITQQHSSRTRGCAIRMIIVTGYVGGIRSLDPGFDGEFLQSEAGGISEIDSTPLNSVEDERLPDHAGGVADVPGGSSLDSARAVERVA